MIFKNIQNYQYINLISCPMNNYTTQHKPYTKYNLNLSNQHLLCHTSSIFLELMNTVITDKKVIAYQEHVIYI